MCRKRKTDQETCFSENDAVTNVLVKKQNEFTMN